MYIIITNIKYLLILFVFLFACTSAKINVPGRKLTKIEQQQFQNVVVAWESLNLPSYNSDCQRHEKFIRIIEGAEHDMNLYCNRCGPHMCSGENPLCMECASACQPMFQKLYPLIVIHESYRCTENWNNLIIHESIHWLGRCTGAGVDANHKSLIYWGKEDSVKSETIFVTELNEDCLSHFQVD